MVKVRSRFKNNAGVGLVGVVVSIAVLAISSYLLMAGYQAVFSSKRRVNSQMSIFSFRSRLMSALGSAEGMAKTISQNPAMQCALATSGSGCQSIRSSGAIQINVFDSDGTQLTSFSNASFGFDTTGTPCSSFSGSGNDACPFRYDVTWQPVCDGSDPSNCLNPQNQVTATFTAKGQSSNSDADVSRYKMNFTIYPSLSVGNMQSQCAAFGGTPSGANCVLPMYGQTCPKGTVLDSVNTTTNTINCKPLLTGTCADGQVMEGITSTGAVVCRPIGYCPKKTKWIDWRVVPAMGGDGGSDGGSDGCDGMDGTDGCT